MKILSLVVLVLTFAVPAAAVDAVLRCDKNHYILDEPCSTQAIEVPIGAVGALAFDPSGVLHFSSQSVVFKLEAGVVTRVAGSGSPGFGGDGGPAVDAMLNFELTYREVYGWDLEFGPLTGGIAFDGAGNLYIADAYNNRIRIVDTAGTIRTFVDGEMGSLFPGYAGYWWPQGVAVDSSGRVYVGGLWVLLLRIPAEDRPIEQVKDGSMDFALSMAVDSSDDVYVAGACSIKKVGRDGIVSLAAGPEHCDWLDPDMFSPQGVALDGQEDLLVTHQNCIRKAHRGKLTTIAGRCGYYGGAGYAGDGGPATQALLRAPRGIVVDGDGNIYIADTGNNRVRMIDRDGIITTVAGNGKRW